MTIRNAERRDLDVLASLAVDTKMFAPEELEMFRGMMVEYFDGGLDGHEWFVDEHDGEVAGAAYVTPDGISQDVANLLFIGVFASARRGGVANALIERVESARRARNDRLLLVETSSAEQFEPARKFYRKSGYDEEARIRDYFSPGEDKIVFRKAL